MLKFLFAAFSFIIGSTAIASNYNIKDGNYSDPVSSYYCYLKVLNNLPEKGLLVGVRGPSCGGERNPMVAFSRINASTFRASQTGTFSAAGVAACLPKENDKFPCDRTLYDDAGRFLPQAGDTHTVVTTLKIVNAENFLLGTTSSTVTRGNTAIISNTYELTNLYTKMDFEE